MHKLTATFFVFLYVLAMLRPVQPYVEYILNQDYIAEFLCINKDKPKLQCNGKCHLVKQIEKQQEEEPISSLRISLENYPIGFVNICKIAPFKIFNNLKKSIIDFYFELYHFDYNHNSFQPPELV